MTEFGIGGRWRRWQVSFADWSFVPRCDLEPVPVTCAVTWPTTEGRQCSGTQLISDRETKGMECSIQTI